MNLTFDNIGPIKLMHLGNLLVQLNVIRKCDPEENSRTSAYAKQINHSLGHSSRAHALSCRTVVSKWSSNIRALT